MQLIQARLREPNFGDDLNGWLWPKILPEIFSADQAEDGGDDPQFLGIGSIISHRFDGPRLKVVFGAAFVPTYGRLPDLGGEDWRFYFVRGPHTAAALGLDPRLALADPAILVRTLIDPAGPRGDRVSFMPHWESLGWGCWPEACAHAGIHLIDPRDSVAKVLDELSASRLVLCEAMHGAIVADALRIPWVPMRPLDPRHRGKWRDWSDSLAIDLRPRTLVPSSLNELLTQLTRRLELLGAARDICQAWPLWPLRATTTRLAARCLRQAAASPGFLSGDDRIEAATDRMLGRLDALRRDWREGRLRSGENLVAGA